MGFYANTYSELSRQELVFTLDFIQQCLKTTNEDRFHELLKTAGEYLGFEYILYVYMKSSYRHGTTINFVNISNPEMWMEEYHSRGYLESDPVKFEVERRLASDDRSSYILWDAYDRQLSSKEAEVIVRRKHYGLEYGFSVYDDSRSKDFTFLISFASAKTTPGRSSEIIAKMIVPHLMVIRKRLDTLTLLSSFSARENEISGWLTEGKTNWEIAQILSISENTVKYHIKNIFNKLKVNNRQQAIAICLAGRYLSM
ncbi:helix-turn-helix transcriptional regulator [Limisalsivibrio acetivorans]|uniref:helix-turn-helix transcriptional regulator n=1 Tax=Limisalsivibrio acetivorans TaxID=1304888 RepID=UPI0003B65427|nr:LuxR family transcriptional regulator [Limisalsivibrio acetivorans]